MSSSQVYPSLQGTITPEHLCGDSTPGVVCTEWYAPSSFAFNDPYMTPYPSSTVESQQWNNYVRASLPDNSMSTFAFGQQASYPQQMTNLGAPGRPRSSPSTFGQSPESIPWPATTNGLGIQYTGASNQPTPLSLNFPPNMFQTYPVEETYATSSPPEIRQPQPRRPYQPIAPNPANMAPVKRRRDDDGELGGPESTASSVSNSTKSKRKRTSSVVSGDLSEDDRFLVQLKEEESLTWKDIANRFQTDKGKSFQVAALQMRYKRLREKFRVWESQDVEALRRAYEYWEKSKWDIISAKMLEEGLSERWPPKHCARKWQEMHAASTPATSGMMTTMSQFSSPIEGPVHFGFLPIS